MNIARSKERAVVISLMDAYGINTIIQHIYPYVEDRGLSLIIALSALNLDKELWIRSKPIVVSDPKTDPNQMAFNIADGIDVLITRTKMEGDDLVPRFDVPRSLQIRDDLDGLSEALDRMMGVPLCH